MVRCRKKRWEAFSFFPVKIGYFNTITLAWHWEPLKWKWCRVFYVWLASSNANGYVIEIANDYPSLGQCNEGKPTSRRVLIVRLVWFAIFCFKVLTAAFLLRRRRNFPVPYRVDCSYLYIFLCVCIFICVTVGKAGGNCCGWDTARRGEILIYI